MNKKGFVKNIIAACMVFSILLTMTACIDTNNVNSGIVSESSSSDISLAVSDNVTDNDEASKTEEITDDSVDVDADEGSHTSQGDNDPSKEEREESEEVSEEESEPPRELIIPEGATDYGALTLDFLREFSKATYADHYDLSKEYVEKMFQEYELIIFKIDRGYPCDESVDARKFAYSYYGRVIYVYNFIVTWYKSGEEPISLALDFSTDNKAFANMCKKHNIPENKLSDMRFTEEDILQFDQEDYEYILGIFALTPLLWLLDFEYSEPIH